MKTFLIIILFLVVWGSMITSFVAVVQILRHDFKESKGWWILLSMIAIIGPILWLTKGRKLLIKKTLEDKAMIKQGFSSKSHYSEIVTGLPTPLKGLLLGGVALAVFGYLVRISSLYFFWESKSIGWTLLLIGITVVLWKDLQSRKSKAIPRVWSSIGFGLLCFILFVKGLMMVLIPTSDAYSAAKTELRANEELILEIGEVESFTPNPSGSLQSSTDASGTYGNAALDLIIKGREKYVERTVFLESTPQKKWTITQIAE